MKREGVRLNVKVQEETRSFINSAASAIGCDAGAFLDKVVAREVRQMDLFSGNPFKAFRAHYEPQESKDDEVDKPIDLVPVDLVPKSKRSPVKKGSQKRAQV